MEQSINERISMVMREYNYRSVNQLANKIGVARTSLNDIVKNNAEPKYSTISKILEAEPSISAEWLLRGKGEMTKQGTNQELSAGGGNSDTEATFSVNENPVKRRIKEAIEFRKTSINAISKVIGVKQNTLSRQINTDNPIPLSNVLLLIDALEIDPSWLLTGKGEMTKQPTNQEIPVSTNNSDMESAFLKKEAFYLRQMNERLDDLIKANETIENLKEEVESLKKRLELAEQDSNKMAVSAVKHKFA